MARSLCLFSFRIVTMAGVLKSALCRPCVHRAVLRPCPCNLSHAASQSWQSNTRPLSDQRLLTATAAAAFAGQRDPDPWVMVFRRHQFPCCSRGSSSSRGMSSGRGWPGGSVRNSLSAAAPGHGAQVQLLCRCISRAASSSPRRGNSLARMCWTATQLSPAMANL